MAELLNIKAKVGHRISYYKNEGIYVNQLGKLDKKPLTNRNWVQHLGQRRMTQGAHTSLG